MTNCFGMKEVHRGLNIHQGPDDRFYAPWPDPLFEADTYEDLIGKIEETTDPLVAGLAYILNKNCMYGGAAGLNELRARLDLDKIAKIIERGALLDVNGAVTNADDLAEEIVGLFGRPGYAC